MGYNRVSGSRPAFGLKTKTKATSRRQLIHVPNEVDWAVDGAVTPIQNQVGRILLAIQNTPGSVLSTAVVALVIKRSVISKPVNIVHLKTNKSCCSLLCTT